MKNIDKQFVINEIRSGKTITEISASLEVSRVTVQSRMKKWGISKKQIQFNENFFETINNEIKAYWLGFIMADGCVSMTHHPKVLIKICNKDGHHLEKWHNAIGSCLKIHRMSHGTQSQHYSQKMCEDLIKLGCTPRKSLTLKFPYLNRLLVRHFVRGYFDGDGCAELRKTGQLRLSFAGTESFLTTLQRHIKTNNGLYPIGNNKIAKQLQIHGNKKAGKIANWMYKNATIFLARKKEVCYSYL